MTSLLKKVTSMILVVLIALLSAVTVIAKMPDESPCPSIRVHGFMASKVYTDKDDPNASTVWPPSTDAIMATVKGSIPALLKLAMDKDWENFADKTSELVYAMFEPAMNDSTGTPRGNSGIRFEYPEASLISSDSDLAFKYDWRKDPVDIAKELNDFINYVLEASGCKQVKIQCHSLGGLITETYMAMYGDAKLRAVVFNSTAIYGETYNGELMSGKIRLNGNALAEFLKYAVDSNENSEIFSVLFDLLDSSGLLDAVSKMGNAMIEKIGDRVSAQCIVPLFGYWLPIWAMVPDESIDEAMDYVFNKLYNGEGYEELKAKIENFNEIVRPNKANILKHLNENANVYVISRYGYSSIPITPSYMSLSDGVIDAFRSSFGATTANYGTTLSDDYLASADMKYISPDKTVDASTCMFPNQTWFIKGLQHASEPDSLDEMICTFLNYSGQGTVDTFEQYPQFLRFSYSNELISPDSANESLSFIQIIRNVFEDIINFLKRISSILFK